VLNEIISSTLNSKSKRKKRNSLRDQADSIVSSDSFALAPTVPRSPNTFRHSTGSVSPQVIRASIEEQEQEEVRQQLQKLQMAASGGRRRSVSHDAAMMQAAFGNRFNAIENSDEIESDGSSSSFVDGVVRSKSPVVLPGVLRNSDAPQSSESSAVDENQPIRPTASTQSFPLLFGSNSPNLSISRRISGDPRTSLIINNSNRLSSERSPSPLMTPSSSRRSNQSPTSNTFNSSDGTVFSLNSSSSTSSTNMFNTGTQAVEIDAMWLIPFSELSFTGKTLGKGFFGEVLEGNKRRQRKRKHRFYFIL
jgi:hypothetical protein